MNQFLQVFLKMTNKFQKPNLTVAGGRIKVEIWVADQISQMQLNIIGVTVDDFKTYRCVAKNSMGESMKKIRLLGNCCNFRRTFA